jgi:uncharacterized protein YceK
MIRLSSLVLLFVLLSGCGTITKVGTTAVGATAGAVAAGVPGAIVGAAAGDLAGELILEPVLTLYEVKRDAEQIIAKEVDDIWSLLGKLSEVAGWVLAGFLILPVIIPLLIGWIIPAPGSKK